MSTFDLPHGFQKSYLDFPSYPCNLSQRTAHTYPISLSAYKDVLDSLESDLFEPDDERIEVPFRDLHTGYGNDLDKLNIYTSDSLTKWLGVNASIDPANPQSQIVSAKHRDPKCRFIYVYGDHARAHLKITRSMLTQIVTFHQVMPAYLDFICVFGSQRKSSQAHAIPELGRSGRQYQLCYNLKSVVLKFQDKTNFKQTEWSIQQAAFHHQFDVIYGTTLWICTKGNLDIQQRFKQLTGKDARPEDKAFGTAEECFRSSLSAHLLYCQWSIENWRWYIKWLERVVDEDSVMAVLGPRGEGHSHQTYTGKNIQDLQRWEEKVNEVIMVLETNINIILSLRRFYDGLKENVDFPLRACVDDIIAFSAQVDEGIEDFKMQIARAKALAKITNDRKSIVSLHLQSQATERMEALNQQMEKEAIVMRIITVVTLIYLPSTFVSTFFSTDIIKYQNQNGGAPGNGSFSKTALARWLTVALPLTLLTLIIAWYWKHRAEGGAARAEKKQQKARKKKKLLQQQQQQQQKDAKITQPSSSSILPFYHSATKPFS